MISHTMCSRRDVADGMAGRHHETPAQWPTEHAESIGATGARFSGKFDTVFSFGDLVEPTARPHEFIENDDEAGSRGDVAGALDSGYFDTAFSFGDSGEQVTWPLELAEISDVGSRFLSGDLGDQSKRPNELAEKANVESGDDVVSGGNMQREFSFGNLAEPALWPRKPAETQPDVCGRGSVPGSAACGSGARAAWRFRNRVIEEDDLDLLFLFSGAQSTKPLSLASALDSTVSTVMVDAQRQRSVESEPKFGTDFTVDIPERRAVKPEPRPRPGASSSSGSVAVPCAPRRRSAKPTPRARAGDPRNRRLEVADAEI
eukprot:TRINITY_DN13617_c2_g1_i1.p1 TRINITY_DN13617_c2_g1~~TRINITY_DN13617_c2_g1_i1.p1  ORF type:complete len:317 (-),score=32.79 TRINITY_DN13617_c2_g1_i1:392-1342(-)